MTLRPTLSSSAGPRRRLLKAACACAAAPLATRNAFGFAEAASAFPTRPTHWICPSSPGAGTDAAARVFAQIASDAWKQPCIVENRSGASGMIGLENVANAAPDGYTLMVMSVSQFLDGTLDHKFTFEANKDLTPLSLLGAVPLILLAHPSTNLHTLPELIAFAKAHPGDLNYGSGGSGGITHFAMELFLKKAGIKATHVPYKGSGPALADLLAGHVQLSFVTPVSTLSQVKAGRLNAIGISSGHPSALIPGIPTLASLGIADYDISTWYAFFGPHGMPPDLVERVASSVIAASGTPQSRERIVAAGMDPILKGPADFTRYLASEREQWAAVARDIGFKRDV